MFPKQWPIIQLLIISLPQVDAASTLNLNLTHSFYKLALTTVERLKPVIAASTGRSAVLAPGWFISVRGSYKTGWCLLSPRDSVFSTIISILSLIFRL